MLRTTRHSRRGVALVLAAVMLVVAFGFSAFAIDLGYIQLVQAELQNAADAAAIAGARALIDGPPSARSAADRIAEENQAGNQAVELDPSVDVEIGIWDEAAAAFQVLSAADEWKGTAVRVTCRRTADRGNALSLFFAPILGKQHADVTGTATAVYEGQPCSHIIGLNSVWLENGDIDSFNSELGPRTSQMPGDNVNVCSNGPIGLASNAYIQGNAHPGAGYTVSGASRVTGSTEPLAEPIVAPPVNPGSAATVNDNSQIPAGLLTSSGFSLSGSSTVNLAPGTYYINGTFSVGGTARLNITGPTTIYVTGDVDISGNGATSGQPTHLKFYPLGATARFVGSSEFSGTVYAPAADITISGNGGVSGAVVGKTVTLKGNPTKIHYDEALKPFSKIFGRGKLVQ